MKQVWKYPLELTTMQTLTVPKGATAIAVQCQVESPVLWALVDPEAEPSTLTVHTFGTGHSIPDDVGDAEYVGTYQVAEGRLIFHVFVQ